MVEQVKKEMCAIKLPPTPPCSSELIIMVNLLMKSRNSSIAGGNHEEEDGTGEKRQGENFFVHPWKIEEYETESCIHKPNRNANVAVLLCSVNIL